MKDNIITREAVEAEIDRGVQNMWYPVLPSWAVSGKPTGITRLCENIVLWRDKSGTAHALEDRCPHRGARLSMGWNKGESIACWYHGVEVDKSGIVKNVPSMHSCPLEGKQCLKSYPVKEICGAVFLYFGTESQPEPVDLSVPDMLTNEGWSSFLCVSNWNTNYRYALDNVLDPMHGIFLHGTSHSMSEGNTVAEMGFSSKSDTGFVFSKKDQSGTNFDDVEFGDTGVLWMTTVLPYPKEAGPGGPFGIVGMICPIDEKHCMTFFWRTRNTDGWKRDTWRFLYKTVLEERHWNVLEQDRLILENMAEGARYQENLYQHDMAITRARTSLFKKVKAQLEEASESAQQRTP